MEELQEKDEVRNIDACPDGIPPEAVKDAKFFEGVESCEVVVILKKGKKPESTGSF